MLSISAQVKYILPTALTKLLFEQHLPVLGRLSFIFEWSWSGISFTKS